MRVSVVGGGLAGIAASIALCDSGHEVHLFEARKQLGGRVASVKHPRLGLQIDNCQHAAFRVYDCFLQLLSRLDCRDIIRLQEKTILPFASPEKKVFSALKTGKLSPPNHMIGSMMSFPFLSMRDKLAMRKVLKSFQKFSDEDQWDMDHISFKDWLVEQGQTERTISRFFGFFTLAALNLEIEESSAAQGIMLFRRGLFGQKEAFNVGVFSQDIGAAMNQKIIPKLREVGVNVHLSSNVKSVEENHLTVGEEKFEHDAVILATPQHLTKKLLTEKEDEVISQLEKLEYRSLIGIHAFYRGNRIPKDFTFASMVDEPVIQILFNRSSELSQPLAGGLQWLSVPVSCADSYLDWKDEQFISELNRVLDALWPDQSGCELVDSLVVKIPKATFAPLPGSYQNRPKPKVSENIFLAGDFVQTGWPSTMEGAVRSGLMAAASLENKKWNNQSTWPDWPKPPQIGDEGWGVY